MSTPGHVAESTVPPDESDLQEWLRRARIAETACKEFNTRRFETIDAKVLELLRIERELRSLDLIGRLTDKVPSATQRQRITFIPSADVLHPGLVDSINAFRHFIDDELSICDERLASKGRTRRDVDGYRSPEALDFGAPGPGYRGEDPRAEEENNRVRCDNRTGGRRLQEKQPRIRRGPRLRPEAEGRSVVTMRTTSDPQQNRRGRRYQHVELPDCRKEGPSNWVQARLPMMPKSSTGNETTAEQTSAAESAERRRKYLVSLKRPGNGGQVARLWAPNKPNVESYSEMLQKDTDLKYAEMLRKEKELEYGKVQLLQSPRATPTSSSSPFGKARPAKTVDQWPALAPITPGSDLKRVQTGAGILPESTIVTDFAYRRIVAKDPDKPSTPSTAPQSPSREPWALSCLPRKAAHQLLPGTHSPASPSSRRTVLGSDAPLSTTLNRNCSAAALQTENSVLDTLESGNTKTIQHDSPPQAIPVFNWADEVELEEMSRSCEQQNKEPPAPLVTPRYVSSRLRFVQQAQPSANKDSGSQTFATEYKYFGMHHPSKAAAIAVETRDASTQTFTMHKVELNHRKSPAVSEVGVSTASPFPKNSVCINAQTEHSALKQQLETPRKPMRPSHFDIVDSITQQYIHDIFGNASTAGGPRPQERYVEDTQNLLVDDGRKNSDTCGSSVPSVTLDEHQHFQNLSHNLKSGYRYDEVDVALAETEMKLKSQVPRMQQHHEDYHEEKLAIQPESQVPELAEQFESMGRQRLPVPNVPVQLTSCLGSGTNYEGNLLKEDPNATSAEEYLRPNHQQHAPLVAIANTIEQQNQCVLVLPNDNDLCYRCLGIDSNYDDPTVLDIPGDSTSMHNPPANGLPRLETLAQTKRAFGGMQLMILELVRDERKKRADEEAADPAIAARRQQAEWDTGVAARWERLRVQGEAEQGEKISARSMELDEPVGLVVHRSVVRFQVKWRLQGGWCDWVETSRFIIQKDTVGARRLTLSSPKVI